VDDDRRKEERKMPAKGSAEFQKVNNFPHSNFQLYKTNKQFYYYQELPYTNQDT
jgi:hypothetical protein